MKWLIKNLVAGFLLFPCNLLLVQALALAIRKRRPRASRVLVAASLAGLAILSMSGVSSRLLGRVEHSLPALDLEAPDLASRADAIVVLGAGRDFGAPEYGGRDAVSPNGYLRLRYGAELQRRARKPILVTGGSADRPGEPEALLMARALRETLGAEARWVEDRSANTAENATMSREILSKAGIRRIFLVTHASHMSRAYPTFVKAGFEQVVPAPMGYLSDTIDLGSPLSWIPSATGVEMCSIWFHEAIGAVWYLMTGAY